MCWQAGIPPAPPHVTAALQTLTTAVSHGKVEPGRPRPPESVAVHERPQQEVPSDPAPVPFAQFLLGLQKRPASEIARERQAEKLISGWVCDVEEE